MTVDAHQHDWSIARGDDGRMGPDVAPILRDVLPADLDDDGLPARLAARRGTALRFYGLEG